MRMEDASSLGAGLIMNKFLVEIDLSQNELQDNAIHFMTNIASNQSIEFIDFSSNRIGTRGTLWILSGLAEKLRRQSNKLIQVRLLNNFYNPSLEEIIHDVNNKHLSAAIRIQRYTQRHVHGKTQTFCYTFTASLGRSQQSTISKEIKELNGRRWIRTCLICGSC